MIKRLSNWLSAKPEKTRLLLYFGLYYIYWFLMWFLWDSIIMKENHSLRYYLLYGLWMAIGWLAFNKWSLIKSVFSKHGKP